MAQIIKTRRPGRRKTTFRVQPQGTDCTVTAAINANKMRLTFSAPVVVKGIPRATVNDASATACTVVSNVIVDLTYAVNVAAGQTWVVPGRCQGVRTLSGGFVASATGTF
jgi:hypothetical protein